MNAYDPKFIEKKGIYKHTHTHKKRKEKKRNSITQAIMYGRLSLGSNSSSLTKI